MYKWTIHGKHLYTFYQTSSHTLLSEVDRRHLIDLMLVGRCFKSRFDSLEFERENGYRHPHCIIVTVVWESRARREYCMKNTHVQAFELIEGSFDSSSWFVLFSLCIDVMLMNVAFLLCIFFVYVVHVISCFKLKSEREREWGSIVSLSEPGYSCKVCSRNSSARSALMKAQGV